MAATQDTPPKPRGLGLRLAYKIAPTTPAATRVVQRLVAVYGSDANALKAAVGKLPPSKLNSKIEQIIDRTRPQVTRASPEASLSNLAESLVTEHQQRLSRTAERHLNEIAAESNRSTESLRNSVAALAREQAAFLDMEASRILTRLRGSLTEFSVRQQAELERTIQTGWQQFRLGLLTEVRGELRSLASAQEENLGRLSRELAEYQNELRRLRRSLEQHIQAHTRSRAESEGRESSDRESRQ